MDYLDFDKCGQGGFCIVHQTVHANRLKLNWIKQSAI